MTSDEEATENDENDLTEIGELIEETDSVTTTRKKQKQITDLAPLLRSDETKTHPGKASDRRDDKPSTTVQKIFNRLDRASRVTFSRRSGIAAVSLLLIGLLELLFLPRNVISVSLVVITTAAGGAFLLVSLLSWDGNDQQNES